MFCPKCGTQLPDDAKFCGACGLNMADAGAQADGASQPSEEMNRNAEETASQQAAGEGQGYTYATQPNQGTAGEQPQGNPTPRPDMSGGAYNYGNGGAQPSAAIQEGSKNFAPIIAVVAVLAVVIVLFFVVKSLFFGGGYKEPLNNIVDLVNDKETDVDKYVEALFPGFINDAYKDLIDLARDEDPDVIDDAYDEAADSIQDAWDDMEDSIGGDLELSYEIRDKEKLDSDELEDIQDAYSTLAGLIPLDELEMVVDMAADDAADELFEIIENLVGDIEDLDVSAGYKLKVRLTLEADGDDVSQGLTLYVIKANGDWMIDYLSTLAKYSGMSISDITEELEDLDIDDIMDAIDDLQYYF